MIQKLHSLMQTLERMDSLYLRMLEILERERVGLVEFNFDSILKILSEKDEVLQVIKSLDRDRLRIQDQFALIMQTPSESVTVHFLVDSLRSQLPIEARRLGEIREQLKKTVDRVTERVQANKLLSEKGISSLQQIARHMTETLPGRPRQAKKSLTYTGKATLRDEPAGAGAIVEKRY